MNVFFLLNKSKSGLRKIVAVYEARATPNIEPKNKSNNNNLFLFSSMQYKIDIEAKEVTVVKDLAMWDTTINLNGSNKMIEIMANLINKNLFEKNLVRYRKGI